MKMQIALEDSFMQIANMVVGQEVVLLIDRGLLDGKAFVDAGSWQALMDDMQMNELVVRDRRYDAVLHLVTAA